MKIRRYSTITDATEKVYEVKRFNFRRRKWQYSECSSKKRMHHPRKKLDPIMKCKVKMNTKNNSSHCS